ncbi:MAG: alkaline phosphatase family protein [Thermoproteus sp.]
MEVPDYNGGGIAAVPNTLLAHFGLPPRGPQIRFGLGLSSRRIALILLDGLGFNTFAKIAGEYSGIFRGLYRATSVFPTTTSAALTSLSTGLAPCQHGVVAWSFYLKEAGAVIDSLNMSAMLGERDGLSNAGYELKALFNAPTVFADLAKVGVRSRAFLPKGLGGGISRILYDGAETFEYISHYDALINAGRFLQQNDAAYAYVYISTVDSVAHRYGPRSDEALAAARGVLDSVTKLARQYMAGADVIVTADHGHEEIARNENLSKDVELLDALSMPPYGDPRALYLKPSVEPRRLAELLARHGEFSLMSREEALEAGLFGSCEGKFAERIGDYIALPGRGLSAIYLYKQKNEDPLKFKGHHGGLTEDELYIPLILL